MTARRPGIGAWRHVVADAYHRRRTAAVAARILTPPPPRRFGAFGQGSYITPPARVISPEHIHLGEDVLIMEYSYLSVFAVVPGHTPRLTIGDRTNVGPHATIACVGEVTIGEDVMTAPRVFIGDTYHRYQDPELPVLVQPMATPEPVVIGSGSFLGIGAAVLMGVELGEHAYVAAGSVVTEDVEPFTLVVGNPARAVRRWDARGEEWVNL